MPSLVKKNEAVALPLFKNGVSLQFFKITFPAAVNAKLGATTAGVPSPVVKALEAIQSACSVEIMAPLQTTNTVLPIAVAALGGDYGTDTWDGTTSETFAAHLEDLVQAVQYASTGTIQSINMYDTTVTAGWPALS